MNFNELYKRIAELDTKATEVKEITETASASINMTGDNAEDVIKLMNALKGQDNAKDIADMPVAIKSKEPMLAPAMGPMDPADDMAKLRDIVDGPKDRDQLKPGVQGEPCKICGKDHLGNSGCGENIEEVVVGGNAKPEDPNSVYARLMGDLSEIQNGAMDDNDMADDIADELGDYLRNGDAPKGSHYEKAIGIVMDAIHDGPQAQAEAAEEAISVLNSAEEESRGNNEDYANEPDETYQDQHYMTKDLSGGSEMGQKKSYPKAAGGDNAMALEDEIRSELQAQLQKHMGIGEGDDEGTVDTATSVAKELKKMGVSSDAHEDEIIKMIPDVLRSLGLEGVLRQMNMSKGYQQDMLGDIIDAVRSMGEGDDEDGDHDDACPECGEPGKKKLMACASCGCS